MYLARFANGTEELIQAAVKLDTSDGLGRIPMDELASRALALELPNGRFGLRTGASRGRSESGLIISCAAENEDTLTSALKELVADTDAAWICADQAEHDELASSFPQRRGWMRPGAYRARNFRLATDFRLWPVRERLFTCAARQGWAVAYQLNVIRRPVSRDDLRWLKKQLVRMELSKRLPERVIELQHAIVGQLPQCAFLIDELVGCDTDQGWHYLHQLLEDEFAVHMNQYGFSDHPLESEGASLLDELVETGFQSETLFDGDPVSRAASALTSGELDELLRWSPAARVAKDVRANPARQGELDAFISYSNRDSNVAASVCDFLENRSIACWMAPRDIGIGQSYPDAIMAAIRASSVLVLIFSNDSNFSPHVQREVERAVSLGVPVLALRLETVAPSAAMEYFLSTSQWLDTGVPPSERHLAHLARRVSELTAERARRG